MRACLGLVFLCTCLPAPTVLVGKACDATHDCGPELFCVAGTCELSPGGGGGGHAGGGVAGGGVAGGATGGGGATAGGSVGGGAAGGNPDGGTCTVEETSCSDGLDNDCDGKIDCADPGCALKACGQGSACCGGDAGCVDLSTDAKNCGGCGISCGSGFTCTPAMAGSVRSGKCGCTTDPDCPQPGPTGLTQDQNCIAGACICDTVVECGTGQKCTKQQGLSDPGFCFY